MALSRHQLRVAIVIALSLALIFAKRCAAQTVPPSSDAVATLPAQTQLLEASRETSPNLKTSAPTETVKEALAAMEKAKVNRWAYTMTTVVDGKKTVERHDPSAPRGKRWELISKEGKTPTDAERRDYAKKRKRDSGMSQLNLKELVDLSSITIEKEDEDQMTCAVRLKTDSQEIRTFAEKMKGQLVVRKASPAIEAFEFINTERIGKRGVFSISELKIGMTYALDPTAGELLPAFFSMRLRGRALLVKSLNSDTEVTFSDFRRPEKLPTAPAAAD